MSNQIQSAIRSGTVTPSDTTVLKFQRLWIGGTGNVKIQHAGADGSTTFNSVPAGVFLDVTGTRVMAATTATNIVWLDW